MLSLFIGSSTEARERGIIPTLVAALSNSFSPRPWYEVFDQGQFTLETLLKVATEVDAALLLFSNDDARDYRGKTDVITRDNVVLEYGLFLSQLGRERVWILKEEGVMLPTDLSGLNYKVFRSRPDNQRNNPVLNADLALRIEEIKKQWIDMPPLPRQAGVVNDSSLGLAATLKLANDQLKIVSENLTNLARDNSVRFHQPFYFDSTSGCLATYAEALGLVTKRFWTTSYMSSGFWTQGDAGVIEANKDMLRRMQQQTGDVTGDARRLFLLSQPPQDAAQAAKQTAIHLDIKLMRVL